MLLKSSSAVSLLFSPYKIHATIIQLTYLTEEIHTNYVVCLKCKN